MKPTPEKLKEYRRLDYERHREAYIARAKAYHSKHREARLAQMAEYAQLKKAEANAWRRERYWSDPEKYRAIKREQGRAAYHRNRDKNLQRTKNWQKKNRWYVNAQKKERKAKIAMVTLDGSAKEFYRWVRSQEFVDCAYCGIKVSGKEAHVDHKIAIARGGAHILANLTASCAVCNIQKGVLTPEEFIKRKEQL